MGFFQKIESDAWLISSTIELTRVQVLGRTCAWLWRYSALFVIAPQPNNREITVFRRCYAHVWHSRILRVTNKSIKWTWAEPFKMNVKIERELNFVVDDSQLFLDAQKANKVSEHTVDR